MKTTKLAALAVAAVVLTGCATTPRTAQFDPNNKGIHFEGGKPYLIPYGANIGKPVDSETIAMLNALNISHNCKKGDMRWMESEYNKYIISTMRGLKEGKITMSEDEFKDTYRSAYYSQRMGCTAALSDVEYDYYKTAQVQRAEQARHQQNLQAQRSSERRARRQNRYPTTSPFKVAHFMRSLYVET